MFEQVVYAPLQNSRQHLTASQWLEVAEGKEFGGKYHERTMNQTENSRVTACAHVSRRYVDLASQIDITSTHPVSSLVQDWMGCLHPLPEVKTQNPLKQGLTHTHTPTTTSKATCETAFT